MGDSSETQLKAAQPWQDRGDEFPMGDALITPGFRQLPGTPGVPRARAEGLVAIKAHRDLKTRRATGRADTFTLQPMLPGEEEEEEELTPSVGDLAGSSQAINLASPRGFLCS